MASLDGYTLEATILHFLFFFYCVFFYFEVLEVHLGVRLGFAEPGFMLIHLLFPGILLHARRWTGVGVHTGERVSLFFRAY